jgi:hypothetical protein
VTVDASRVGDVVLRTTARWRHTRPLFVLLAPRVSRPFTWCRTSVGSARRRIAVPSAGSIRTESAPDWISLSRFSVRREDRSSPISRTAARSKRRSRSPATNHPGRRSCDQEPREDLSCIGCLKSTRWSCPIAFTARDPFDSVKGQCITAPIVRCRCHRQHRASCRGGGRQERPRRTGPRARSPKSTHTASRCGGGRR